MVNEKISELIRPQVRYLRAYHVEEPPAEVKLHANESPFDISDKVREEIREEIAGLEFNRYPDADCTELRTLIAGRLGVGLKQVLLGNGSDELIQMIIMAFGGHGAPVIFPQPTFSMYRNIALFIGEDVRPVPLTENFELDDGRMLEEVEKGPSITFISYPNNPTGNCFSEKTIEDILASSKGIVVVDEAYFDYSGKTFLDRLADHPNLVILRTLSKIGMASLRIGMLIASEEVADIVNRVRLPYNIGALPRIAALKVLESGDDILRASGLIIAERSRLFDALSGIPSITPFRTDSNFILFRVEDPDSIFKRLAGAGVLIRNLSAAGPLEGCLRVTVGAPHENDRFIQVLKGWAGNFLHTAHQP